VTYTADQAKPLLTADEFQLFTDSFDPAVGKLGPDELRQAVQRCRNARDKYRDLQRRQAGQVREQAGARGAALDANERTADKGDIFAEALERYEEALAAAE
jgi:hypothetical protein